MACIFCKIVNNELSADIIFQNDKVIIFKDINPQAETHLLVVPKEHIDSVDSAGSEDVIKDLISAAKEVARQKNLEGYKLVFNVGEKAGQTVNHLHMHLLAAKPGEKMHAQLNV